MSVTSVLSDMSPLPLLLNALSSRLEPLKEGGVREGEAVMSRLSALSAMASGGCVLPWLPALYTIWLGGPL